mmetsp:Transcript_71191/g.118325  ORF Transcript_71191/g.118325 Transcript_71191/m.118325 type:complete len:331 (+) Transcript_71191:25-1017(+)
MRHARSARAQRARALRRWQHRAKAHVEAWLHAPEADDTEPQAKAVKKPEQNRWTVFALHDLPTDALLICMSYSIAGRLRLVCRDFKLAVDELPWAGGSVGFSDSKRRPRDAPAPSGVEPVNGARPPLRVQVYHLPTQIAAHRLRDLTFRSLRVLAFTRSELHDYTPLGDRGAELLAASLSSPVQAAAGLQELILTHMHISEAGFAHLCMAASCGALRQLRSLQLTHNNLTKLNSLTNALETNPVVFSSLIELSVSFNKLNVPGVTPFVNLLVASMYVYVSPPLSSLRKLYIGRNPFVRMWGQWGNSIETTTIQLACKLRGIKTPHLGNRK